VDRAFSNNCLHPARYRVGSVPRTITFLPPPISSNRYNTRTRLRLPIAKRGCAYHGVQEDGRISFALCSRLQIAFSGSVLCLQHWGLTFARLPGFVFLRVVYGRLPGGYCYFCFIIFIGTGVRLMDERGVLDQWRGTPGCAFGMESRHEDRHVDR
jgi:hypothetical protein